MKNVSLARIMYGTNEDRHVPAFLYQPATPLLPNPNADSTGAEVASSQTSLGDFLHQAWAVLHPKR